jgi:hypothetical protein
MSVRKRQGLAPPPSGAGGEGAPEAGPGRQSLGIGGGSRVRDRSAQAGWSSEALGDGRRLGSLPAMAFDEAMVNAVLAVCAALRRTRVATRASKAVTFGPSHGRQRRGRGVPSRGLETIGSPAGSGGIRSRRPACAQALTGPADRVHRNGCSSWRAVKHVLTRAVRWGSAPSDAASSAQARQHASGVEESDRCTCRASVAEVGKEHLSRQPRGRRKASGHRRGSVRRRSTTADGGGSHRST